MDDIRQKAKQKILQDIMDMMDDRGLDDLKMKLVLLVLPSVLPSDFFLVELQPTTKRPTTTKDNKRLKFILPPLKFNLRSQYFR